MEKHFCDRCGAEVEKHRNHWVRYYDRREDPEGGYAFQNGNSRMEICSDCLDDLKPFLDKRNIRQVGEPIRPSSCSDCWWCRLKRKLRRERSEIFYE